MLELDDIQSGVLRPRPIAVRCDLHPASASTIAEAGRELMRRLAGVGRVGGAPDEPGRRHLGQRRAHVLRG